MHKFLTAREWLEHMRCHGSEYPEFVDELIDMCEIVSWATMNHRSLDELADNLEQSRLLDADTIFDLRDALDKARDALDKARDALDKARDTEYVIGIVEDIENMFEIDIIKHPTDPAMRITCDLSELHDIAMDMQKLHEMMEKYPYVYRKGGDAPESIVEYVELAVGQLVELTVKAETEGKD